MDEQATTTETAAAEPRFKCQACGKGFGSRSGLVSHRRRSHPEPAGRCPRCDKPVKARGLTSHLRWCAPAGNGESRPENALAACRRALEPLSPDVRALVLKLLEASS